MMDTLVVWITVGVGLLTLVLGICKCCVKGESENDTLVRSSSRKSAAKAVMDPFSSLRPVGAISSRATAILTNLNFPDSKPQATVAVDMSNLDDNSRAQELAQMVALLSEISLVYILVASSSDEQESTNAARVLQALGNLLPSHRVLHFSTTVGKIAMVRMIKPHLHVDCDETSFQALKAHIRVPVLVSEQSRTAVSGPEHIVRSIGEIESIKVLKL